MCTSLRVKLLNVVVVGLVDICMFAVRGVSCWVRHALDKMPGNVYYCQESNPDRWAQDMGRLLKRGPVSKRTKKRRQLKKGNVRDHRYSGLSLTQRLGKARKGGKLLRMVRQRMREVSWPRSLQDEMCTCVHLKDVPIYVLNGDTADGDERWAEWKPEWIARVKERLRNRDEVSDVHKNAAKGSDGRMNAMKVRARGVRAKARKSVVMRGWIDMLESIAAKDGNDWYLMCEDDVDLTAFVRVSDKGGTAYFESGTIQYLGGHLNLANDSWGNLRDAFHDDIVESVPDVKCPRSFGVPRQFKLTSIHAICVQPQVAREVMEHLEGEESFLQLDSILADNFRHLQRMYVRPKKQSLIHVRPCGLNEFVRRDGKQW